MALSPLAAVALLVLSAGCGGAADPATEDGGGPGADVAGADSPAAEDTPGAGDTATGDLDASTSDVAALPDAEPDGASADAGEDAGPAVDVPPPLPGAPASLWQTRLEGVVLDASGESPQLKVDLPPGTTSVLVMIESELDYAFFTLKTVVTPMPLGQIIVKGAGDATCIPCANRVSAAQKVAAFLLPNDPQIQVAGGEWLMRIRSTGILKTAAGISYPPQPGVCDVTIVARTEPVPDTGRLVVHVHLTGAGGLDAAAAATDERLQGALADAAAILAGAGITLEVGGYHDVPGAADDPTLVDLESTLGAPNDLSKLLLTGQGDDVAALNLFFVNSIYRDGDFAGGGLVLGIAAGVPGPAFLGPTYRSGVAVALFDFGRGTDYLGQVIAHEVSHYLGLYHSTEKDAVWHDTLLDTAEDDPANLMYWAYSADQVAISEAQAWVLRSHPLVLPP